MTELPPGRTARRLEWAHLPPALRSGVERRLGSQVVDAESRNSGFTPGFASVLTCADGSRHFVKAASTTAMRAAASSYRAEAAVLATLPEQVPAPRLRWVIEEEWLALGIEYVDAREPARPWRAGELDAALEALEASAVRVPATMRLPGFAAEFADLPGCWEHVASTRPDLPHRVEAAELAAGFAEVVGGDHLVHTEARADNLLLRPNGTAVVCDWTWPARGAPWIDAVHLLLGAYRDGIDVQALVEEHPLTRDVPAEHVDVMLALLTGFFTRAADGPDSPASPYLRHHQAQGRDAAWSWLCRRRGWA